MGFPLLVFKGKNMWDFPLLVSPYESLPWTPLEGPFCLPRCFGRLMSSKPPDYEKLKAGKPEAVDGLGFRLGTITCLLGPKAKALHGHRHELCLVWHSARICDCECIFFCGWLVEYTPNQQVCVFLFQTNNMVLCKPEQIEAIRRLPQRSIADLRPKGILYGGFWIEPKGSRSWIFEIPLDAFGLGSNWGDLRLEYPAQEAYTRRGVKVHGTRAVGFGHVWPT